MGSSTAELYAEYRAAAEDYASQAIVMEAASARLITAQRAYYRARSEEAAAAHANTKSGGQGGDPR